MHLPTLLSRKFSLPHITTKQLIFLVLWIILPNIFFLSIAWFNNLARPIINLDYLFGLLLLLLSSPLLRRLGLISVGIAFLLDALALSIQIFPFLDLSTLIYFAPFIPTAPIRYLILIGVLFTVWLAWLLFTCKSTSYFHQTYTFASILLLLGFAYMALDFRYDQYKSSLMGRNNYYIAHGVSALLYQNQDVSFHQSMLKEPELIPIQPSQKNAQEQLKNPPSKKILYIVAESLGSVRMQGIQDTMLATLKQQHQFEFFKQGSFDFKGATVQAELRELCRLDVRNGYAFRKLTHNPFTHCLPNQLKQQGYRTIALHGATSILYDRQSWYPKAGFDKLIFNEHLLQLARCTAFKGTCDNALKPIIIEEFGKNTEQPLFFYWLTLTSHSPFSQDDIVNHRFNCSQFGLQTNGDLCRNLMLHTQFFDNLSNLLKHPNMQGTEVMIIGDHMPPIWGHEPTHLFLKSNHVSWFHFKTI
ncbi:sulfatase-like hydrolase/transferase [Vitreoscilla stercoraria]|uniref:Sulfatase-like hydrolase/transferase n=1 Tax=Vitreoscilla stercoraria TaxID=61 RepID=A0ABY4EC52_VITST|nr:sulfatase-like hydrolase/transferase [Vitreoscilla stercoraria]UOO92871.1 sulfatase-like hydrolase/transferase [Vitreoscilla stercoraria]